jgi:signal peptidase I
MRFEEILVIATIVTGIICLVNYINDKVKRTKHRKQKQFWVIEYSKSFFPVLALVLVFRSFLFEPFRIPSGSMKPTLLIGDFVLINKFSYGVRLPVTGTLVLPLGKPQTGDILVFRHDDGKDFIKRVVGVPGDHVQYIHNQLYINGELLPTTFKNETMDDEHFTIVSQEQLSNVLHLTYIYPSRSSVRYPYSDVIVPEGKYFVMGDNRNNSGDSRMWGFVSEKDILGKAMATWMSWDSSSSSFPPIRWQRIGKGLYQYTGKE